MINPLVVVAGLGCACAIFAFYPRTKEEHGFVFENYPSSKYAWGSGPNPKKWIRGYIWTPYRRLKSIFNKKANSVFVDNFRFFKDFERKSDMVSFFKNKAESTKILFTPLQLTQGMLVIGKMGSGKTVFYNSLLSQPFYSRALIHDVKQDTIETFYLPRKDIILCPFDARGHLWDIMSEDEGTIQTFFNEYLNAVLGEKMDYFKAASQKKFNDVALQVKTSYKDATAAQKWLLFVKILREIFDEIDAGAQKSEKDVKATMEQILEPLEIMAFQMQDPTQKNFTIKEFFKKQNQAKLILSNTAEFEKSLKPLFSAFIACFSQIHVSMPDTKSDFTLYALDEYLSFVQNMDESTRKRIHTLIRSKGGILVGGVQYLPTSDKKLLEELTSSAFAWLYFSTIQRDTLELFINTIKETEYSVNEKNESWTGGKKTVSNQQKKESVNLINSHILNGLGEDYSHITFIPQLQVLYKGYTPQIELKKRHEGFVKRDLTPFYELKYKTQNKINIDALSKDDMFKKSLSKLEKYVLYKEYESTKNKEDFAQKNDLQDVNFDLFFKDFLPDDEVLQSKMNMLTLQERYDLASEWNSIENSDNLTQLEFIEKNELQGALPGIFTFSVSQIQELNF